MTTVTRVFFVKGRQPRKHKFNARKTEIDGIVFASKLEGERYSELKLLERAGEITDLVIQPKFVLQEEFTDRYGKRQRSITYIADFQYIENDVEVVEDTKGFLGIAVWRIKKKMFLLYYPQYDLRIVERPY